MVGRIVFRDGMPGTEIELSADAARWLADRAPLGFRPAASWPGALAERLLPRMLGRGLAHEIGDFVLRSPQHDGRGLMRAGLTPELAPEPAGPTHPAECARIVRERCLPPVPMQAKGAGASLAVLLRPLVR